MTPAKHVSKDARQRVVCDDCGGRIGWSVRVGGKRTVEIDVRVHDCPEPPLAVRVFRRLLSTEGAEYIYSQHPYLRPKPKKRRAVSP